MLDENFNFSDVPEDWTLCYVSECGRRDECMRYQVQLKAPRKLTQCPCVLPTVLKGKSCPHFMPIRLVQAAAGFKDIFREVKAVDLPMMRERIKQYLGGNGTYYLYRNGKKLLMPEQQAWIRRFFKRCGYDENVEFEEYRNVYLF